LSWKLAGTVSGLLRGDVQKKRNGARNLSIPLETADWAILAENGDFWSKTEGIWPKFRFFEQIPFMVSDGYSSDIFFELVGKTMIFAESTLCAVVLTRFAGLERAVGVWIVSGGRNRRDRLG
jgi:hypothetical protein